MNEAETRAELIDPALKEAGWGVVELSRVRREMIAPGRLQGGGRRSKEDIADYVLVYRNQKLAVIEAKRRDAAVTEGLAQAKRYSEKLQARFAFSTNGEGIYRVDMETGEEGHIDRYPTPDELWDANFAETNEWRDGFLLCLLRIRVALGRRGIISTMPSTKRWKRLPLVRIGFCLR